MGIFLLALAPLLSALHLPVIFIRVIIPISQGSLPKLGAGVGQAGFLHSIVLSLRSEVKLSWWNLG